MWRLLATVISHPLPSQKKKKNFKGVQSREEQEDLGSPSAGGTGGGQGGRGAGSKGNSKAEMGGTGGTMDEVGLRQTKLGGRLDSAQNTGR